MKDAFIKLVKGRKNRLRSCNEHPRFLSVQTHNETSLPHLNRANRFPITRWIPKPTHTHNNKQRSFDKWHNKRSHVLRNHIIPHYPRCHGLLLLDQNRLQTLRKIMYSWNNLLFHCINRTSMAIQLRLQLIVSFCMNIPSRIVFNIVD